MNLFTTLLFVFAQQPQIRQELTVTGSMVPVEFSDCGRTITVLDRKDIETAAVSSLQELLQIVGVQVQERGAWGIQSDISLRGASFEQTLILIDGVKMIDPQTGHHLLNIPVSLEQIERIEILRGPGSRIYGPNAFGGVINLITRKSAEKPQLELSYGENDYQSQAIQGGVGNDSILFRYMFKHRASGGYIDNTDFDQQTLNISLDLHFENQSYQIMLGEDEKDFGANRFYHPDFPEQREETRARLAKLNGSWLVGSFKVQSNLSHRIHNDDFVLDSQRPDWYRNIHETRVTALDIKASRTNKLGMFSFGVETISETIESSNLGDHDRDKSGLFLEQQFSGKNWDVLLGTAGYEFSDHGWEWWPGLDLAWHMNSNAKLFGSIARSFRLPTFTELYYTGGGNVGNPDLEAEQAWNYELGYAVKRSNWQIQASWFIRNAENMIDWIWNDTTRLYDATNFSEMDTQGVELELIKSFPTKPLTFDQIRLFYTYLDSELNTSGLVTKYLIGHPDHSASLVSRFSWTSRLDHSWTLRYESGSEIETRLFLDVKAQIPFKNIAIQLLIDNVGDKIVEDFNRVPLPGRWVRVGLTYRPK